MGRRDDEKRNFRGEIGQNPEDGGVSFPRCPDIIGGGADRIY